MKKQIGRVPMMARKFARAIRRLSIFDLSGKGGSAFGGQSSILPTFQSSILFALLAAVMLAMGANQATAASGVWTNSTGGFKNWTNTLNWSSGNVPNAVDDTADFSQANITVNVTNFFRSNVTVGQVYLGDSDGDRTYTIGTNTPGVGLIFAVSSGSAVISQAVYSAASAFNEDITLSNDLVIVNGSTANSLTFRRSITNSAGRTVTVRAATSAGAGSGTVSFEGANTFSNLVVESGTANSGGTVGDPAFGAVPGSYVADAIRLSGGGILRISPSSVTNTANRGITLETGGGGLNSGAAGRTFTVNSPIVGSGDLSIYCDVPGSGNTNGIVVLAANNTYTGVTVVKSGGLRIPAGGSITGSLSVTVSTNALLQLQHASALSPSASLYLVSSNPAAGGYGRVELAFTGAQTVEALYLDGVKQERGTYGSSGSGAMVQNNNWFANNGVLEVSPTALAVMNRAASDFATNAATFNGFLSCTGASPTTVAVLWGEQDGGQTWNWAHTNWFDGDAWTNGSLLGTNITGLDPDTTYYYTFAATNTEAGVVASPSGVTATRTDVYVQLGGTAVYPYNAWPIAFSSIKPAVDYASTNIATRSVVTVSNGTYGITAQISITNGITVRSFGNGVYGGLANASNTTVWRTGSGFIRIFNITHASAVLDGLSITNGFPSGGNGGGVLMTGGTVSNCIVRNNRASGNDQNFDGGGIYASGNSRIVNCLILSNIAGGNKVENEGGGVYSASATVTIRNCLIANNSAIRYGGGVYLENGRIENCTIVGNWITGAAQAVNGAGGGVYREAGTVSNSIVYFNTIPAASTTGQTNINTTVGLAYSCTVALGNTSNGNIQDDPLFVNRAGGDYRLKYYSPCIDTGTNQTWMDGATDLAGNARKLFGGVAGTRADPIVDMGAYEFVVPAEPIIRNLPVSNVTTNGATFNGWLNSTGASPTTVYVLWGTQNGAVSGSWANTNWFAEGEWGESSYPFTNMTLDPDLTYYYTFGAVNAASNVMADQPSVSVTLITGGVTVEATDAGAQFPGNTGEFVIRRPETATNEALTVTYAMSGTASNGVHYSLLSGSAYMVAGVTSAVVTVNPLVQLYANLDAVLTLTPGAGDYALGVVTQQTVTLLAAASDVQFWSGAVNTSWTNAANWTNAAGPGSVPTAADNVVINGGANQPTLDLTNGSVTIASLAIGQSLASTLTFSYGDVTNKMLIVTNDVVIGPAGTLTHVTETDTAAPWDENHRLCLVVGGNLTIAAGGQINVDTKGYASGTGPGARSSGRDGGGYGGQGADYGGGFSDVGISTTYGSITNPVNSGSGGDDGRGAGTVVLRVTGAATHNGLITAKGGAGSGNAKGGGAGGTINLSAASIAGNGIMSADGGDDCANDNGGTGGGGRIAVRVTGGGEIPASLLTGTNITAYGRNPAQPAQNYGAAGTIYLKTATRNDLIVNNGRWAATGGEIAKTLMRDDTNQFFTIIITNSGIFAVGTNAQLNLDGCTLRSDSTINSITSRMVVQDNGTLNWTGTWTNNGCISWYSNNYAQIWTGSLVVASNAILTHEIGSTHNINLNLTGSLTVDAGGSIFVEARCNAAFDGRLGRAGSGHGGEGGTATLDAGSKPGTTYGSITNPVTYGSKAFENGGGVVILNVGGSLTNNGFISARGWQNTIASMMNPGGASGGSINITVAGDINSSGTITADGGSGDAEAAYDGPGGGGRIAIKLTGAGKTFGNVDLTKVTSQGGRESDGLTPASWGADGTIYLKSGDESYGKLLIRGNNSSTTARTLLSPSVTGTTVGDVELQSPAKLAISSNATLTVYGSWSNAVATMTGGTNYGGTVVFAGTSPNPVTVWGGNTWSNLTIVTAGKIVSFQHTVTQTVYGIPAFSNVTLRSTLDNTQWHLRKPGVGMQDVGRVMVRDSHAGTNTTHLTFRGAPGSSGGNNVNWILLEYSGTRILLW